MIDPENVVLTEEVNGETAHLMYVETWDGLYTAIGVRKPAGDGPFPIVLLAAGNGGEGMGWVRDAMANRAWIMDRLAEAGMASAWLRYRTEVELGYNDGGKLVRDVRQGREMFSRSPLEYEDEIAVIDHLKTLDWVDADRIGLIGMSHGGEMVLKVASEYHGVRAAVASEPAAHEYLALTPDDTAFVAESGMRNIEEMQMGGNRQGAPPHRHAGRQRTHCRDRYADPGDGSRRGSPAGYLPHHLRHAARGGQGRGMGQP